jgi:YidC/Oxa1 family membrane protein insertase
MDKTGKIVIAAALALIIFWGPIQDVIWPPKIVPMAPKSMSGTNAMKKTTVKPGVPTAEPTPLVAQLKTIATEKKQELAVLENEHVLIHFSTLGGGIRKVVFKGYNVKDEPPASINDQTPTSALDLAKIGSLEFGEDYKLETSSGTVIARRETPEFSITKTYRLEQEYVLSAEIKLVNKTKQILSTPDKQSPLLAIGTSSPLSHLEKGDYLGFGWLNEADKYATGTLYNVVDKPWYAFWQKPRFKSFTKEVKARWICVHNQFFALIVTPKETQFSAIHADAVPFDRSSLPYARDDQKGIFVYASVQAPALAAEETRTLSYQIYAGPRDYKLLDALGQKQGYAMNYGMWAYFCKLLLGMMVWFHGLFGNWGVAIIAMTTVIKLIFWPLTNASTRSMKRMQFLAPKMKEIQERYRDDPQKLQKETWKLYADYGMTPLSPLGGCLPMFVQIPIFFALFSMLRSTVQLRGAEFLWINDLSMPDTVFHIGSIPINPMPLLMVVAQIWQMRIMPATTTDPSQKMMMWMMPMVFLLICYNFASALALYWTVQTILQALQTYLIKNEPAVAPQKVKKPKSLGMMFGRALEEKRKK